MPAGPSRTRRVPIRGAGNPRPPSGVDPPVTIAPPTSASAPDDPTLVRLAVTGDERAMRLLWTRHRARVDAVVRRFVADGDRAADVAQEVWIQIFRALPGWRGDAQFGTWIHRVAVNRTLNAIRGDKRRERVETSLDAAVDGGDGDGGAALGRALAAATAVAPDGDRSFVAEAIQAAAARLAPGAREIFLLHDVEGWTHEEIATRLGITVGGSKSQLFKARARLRTLLAPLVEDGGIGAARARADAEARAEAARGAEARRAVRAGPWQGGGAAAPAPAAPGTRGVPGVPAPPDGTPSAVARPGLTPVGVAALAIAPPLPGTPGLAGPAVPLSSHVAPFRAPPRP